MIHVIHEAVRWDSRALFPLFFFFKAGYYGAALPKCYIENLVFVKKTSLSLTHTKHDERYLSGYRNTSKKIKMKPNKEEAIISQIQDRFV